MVKITTGADFLDRFLDGGYDHDIVTTLYGPSGSGKTNLCIIAAVKVAESGGKVIFVDTEGGFSVERVKQIVGGGYEKILESIWTLCQFLPHCKSSVRVCLYRAHAAVDY